MTADSKPWNAEWEVSLPLAKRLIDSQFPDLAPAEVAPLGEGWDNLAVLVNQSLVFRFPRRTLGAEVMLSELAVLPHLAPKLTTPIPSLAYVGRSSGDYPCAFAGYARLPGVTACSVDLTDSQRRAMAAPLANFLRELHAIDERQARDWGAPNDQLRRTEIPLRTERGRKELARARKLGLLSASRCDKLMRRLDDIDADPPPPADGVQRPRRLVHGDLYVRHLLINEEGELTGVIDWGDVHCGDPAIDLAAAYCYLPPDSLARFFDLYGAIDAATRRIAIMRAIQHTALLAPYANDIGDKDLLRAVLWSLERLEQCGED